MGPLGIGLGINVALRGPISLGQTRVTITGTLAQGILGQPYSSQPLTVTPPGSKTRVRPEGAAALAALGLVWNGTTHMPEGTPA